jgi:hypothetical protein
LEKRNSDLLSSIPRVEEREINSLRSRVGESEEDKELVLEPAINSLS